jgi:hypothetical protein
MAGYAVPILTLTGLSFANEWYSDNTVDLKIPVAGGVAYLIAALLSEIPDVAPIVTGVAWVALAGAVVIPVAQGQKSIIDPLLSLGNS